MLHFLKKHWLAAALILCAGVMLAFDPVRNILSAGIAGALAIVSFIGRLLTGGQGTIGQPDAGPEKQIDDDLGALQSRGASAERLTQEAIDIVAGGKGKDPQ